MHEGFKIGIATGAVGAVVGLALQTAQDPQWQTIGQGWMLGGVAGVAILGGVSALSSKWKSYKEEQALELSIEKLQRHVSFPHSDNVFDHLHDVASQGVDTLMHASESKKTAFMTRMREISIALVGGQNTLERHEQVSATALLTLSHIAWELNVPRNLQAQDLAYVPKDNVLAATELGTISTWDTSNTKDMTAVFKPAPIDAQSTAQWSSGGSPSMG